jgi:hypothetical protein
VPRVPKYPVSQLVTWELDEYRTALETALTRAPDESADHQLITTRLAEVAGEQDERAHVFDLPARWSGDDGDAGYVPVDGENVSR